MRHIVILSAFVTPLRSGAEACAEEVALRLADQYDITIVTAKMTRGHPSLEGGGLRGGEKSVHVIRIGLGFTFDKWLYPFLAPFVVRKLKPDIIHAVLETFAGLALHFCQWVVPGAKRMLTLQTTNRNLFKKTMMRSPHTLTAISSVLVNMAKAAGRNDVVCISNGISLDVIAKARGSSKKVTGRILFVGRLEPMKGVDILLKAFDGVAEQFPNAHIRIVGDGSFRSKLQAITGKLQISHRVVFVGHIPPPDVYKEFAQAEIFCGLSRSEALGNVFLEAQAAGCAVIGTTVGGIPDIVQNGKTGILVHPNDVQSAAEAITLLLTNTTKRQKLSDAGIDHASGFDWDRIAIEYARLYDALVQD